MTGENQNSATVEGCCICFNEPHKLIKLECNHLMCVRCLCQLVPFVVCKQPDGVLRYYLFHNPNKYTTIKRNGRAVYGRRSIPCPFCREKTSISYQLLYNRIVFSYTTCVGLHCGRHFYHHFAPSAENSYGEDKHSLATEMEILLQTPPINYICHRCQVQVDEPHIHEDEPTTVAETQEEEESLC